MKEERHISKHIDELMAQAEASERIRSGPDFLSKVHQRIDELDDAWKAAEPSVIHVFLRYAAVLLITLLNLGALFLYAETDPVGSQPPADAISEFAEQYFPDYTYTDLEEGP